MIFLKNGFYCVLDKLCKEDSEASFRFLENIKVTEHLNAFNFLHGFCADFAAMLSDIYGYEIVSIRHYDEDDVIGKLIHAYCVAEIQGQAALIDIRGITTDPVLFFEEFENEATYYPEDDEFWDLEGPVLCERWPNKDALFDGDFEGWVDDEIRDFIITNADLYDTFLFALNEQKKSEYSKVSLGSQINSAAKRAVKAAPADHHMEKENSFEH